MNRGYLISRPSVQQSFLSNDLTLKTMENMPLLLRPNNHVLRVTLQGILGTGQ